MKLGISLLAAAALAAVFDPSQYQYRIPLRIHEPDRFSVVRIDRTMYARCRLDLGDLRIARNGLEVPYTIEKHSGGVQVREQPARLINQAVVPGQGLEVALDLGEGGRHSRVRIDTGEINFRSPVRVETSDDQQFWAMVRDDAWFFDFSQGDRQISSLAIDYPVSTRRYLRLRIKGWTNPGAIRQAWVALREQRPTVRDIIDSGLPERTEDAATQSTLLVIDLGQDGLPHDRVRLEAGLGSFHRAVEVESSHDRKQWRFLTRGVIYRVTGSESLAIEFPERFDRYVRVRIFNGDNQPIPEVRTYVETPRRTLRFPPYAAGEFWIYLGNPEARPPRYDLAAVLAREEPRLEGHPSVGEFEPNPDYRPPEPPDRPWTEQYPTLLPTALIVSIALMALLTVRFLRKVRGAGPPAR